MTDLIKRLEEATEGSRKLDSLIGRAVVPGMQEKYEIYKDSPLAVFLVPGVLPYTSSLDAALTLVPEGYGFDLVKAANTSGAAKFVRANCWEPDGEAREGISNSIAIALCIAALKARGVK